MAGGGAERVIGLLADGFAQAGWETTLMLTSQKVKDSVGYRLSNDVTLVSIHGKNIKKTKFQCLKYALIKHWSRLYGWLCEKLSIPVSKHLAYGTFICQYYDIVFALSEYLAINPEMSIIAFLQPAVNAALLANEGLNHKLIISERADPERYHLNRYMPYFSSKWYPKAYKIVFQTPTAQASFSEDIKKKSLVIFNPLNPYLPEAYHGQRRKVLVNFCRITQQKNLPLLIDAFELFSKEIFGYQLHIWGEGEAELEIKAYIKNKKMDSSIYIFPFDAYLHNKIKDCAMFVSSSDYEGMSNSMLEALAIGLPSICTDCPPGGASAIIQNGINGLLVPIRDKVALCDAMKNIALTPGLADRLSQNAEKIRDELSQEAIVKKWIELFD